MKRKLVKQKMEVTEHKTKSQTITYRAAQTLTLELTQSRAAETMTLAQDFIDGIAHVQVCSQGQVITIMISRIEEGLIP